MNPPFELISTSSVNLISTSLDKLSKNERREIAGVLHNACVVNGTKVNLLSAIDLMCESLKRIILDDSNESLVLPTILPIEKMEGITE